MATGLDCAYAERVEDRNLLLVAETGVCLLGKLLDPAFMAVKLMAHYEAFLLVGLLVLEDGVNAAFQAGHSAFKLVHAGVHFTELSFCVLVQLGKLLTELLAHIGYLFTQLCKLIVVHMSFSMRCLAPLIKNNFYNTNKT
jgi:hypothetical protein